MNKNKGFTLLELLLTMSFGGLLGAAALTMIVVSHKLHATQNAFLTAQQSASSIELLVDSIRAATEHDYLRRINASRSGGGIVTSATSYGYGFTAPNIAISQAEVGPSYTTVKSDQLVLKYKPKNTKGLDCEGNRITSTSTEVVERWYARVVEGGMELALACDAGRFDGSAITGLGDNGVDIIPSIDQFSIRLSGFPLQPTVMDIGSNSIRNSLRYRDMTLARFMSNPDRPLINAVTIGILARSVQPFGSEAAKVNNWYLGEVVDEFFRVQTQYNASSVADAEQYVQVSYYRVVNVINQFS